MNEQSQQQMPQNLGRILAVDDDATSLLILRGLLEEQGYEVLDAQSGTEALCIVEREAQSLDVIVLDKMMPEMDGLQVVAHLKDDEKARHIPIVMLTGSNKPEEVKEGIDAGVFYYMTKPFEDNIFQSVLFSAIRESQRRKTLKSELKKHNTSFGFLNKAEFTIQKLDEAEDLACFLANCFSNPDTALPGLADLLVNAVEHGNLEIGYETKTQLLENGTWRAEIESRESDPAFQERVVRVEFLRNEQQTYVTITDQGKGFDWHKYLDIDPVRALDSHGRGIAQANKISFDELNYNKAGNQVIAVSHNNSKFIW